MKIYAVVEGYDYEGASLDSVFSTKELAEKRIEKLELENNISYKQLVECEIDDPEYVKSLGYF